MAEPNPSMSDIPIDCFYETPCLLCLWKEAVRKRVHQCNPGPLKIYYTPESPGDNAFILSRTDARRCGDVEHLIRNLAEHTNSPEALSLLEEKSTSCIYAGTILEKLMEPGSIKRIIPHKVLAKAFEDIDIMVGGGKLVIVDIGLPIRFTQHVFTILPLQTTCSQEPTHARITHSWQNRHHIRAEIEMPIKKLLMHLRKIMAWDWFTKRNELREIFEEFFGADDANMIMSEISDQPGRRRKPIFKSLTSGLLKRPLDESERQRLDGLIRDGNAIASAVQFVRELCCCPISGACEPSTSGACEPTTFEVLDMSTVVSGAEAAASEDSEQNSYDFFRLQRNTPAKTDRELVEAYNEKLECKPFYVKEEDWRKKCTENAMVILREKYPVLKEVMEIANEMSIIKSDVSDSAVMLYPSGSEEED